MREFTIFLSSPAELACDLEVLVVPPAVRKGKSEVVQESEVLPEATEVDGEQLGQGGTLEEPQCGERELRAAVLSGHLAYHWHWGAETRGGCCEVVQLTLSEGAGGA